MNCRGWAEELEDLAHLQCYIIILAIPAHWALPFIEFCASNLCCNLRLTCISKHINQVIYLIIQLNLSNCFVDYRWIIVKSEQGKLSYRVHATEQISRSHMGCVDKVCGLTNHTPVNAPPPFLQRKQNIWHQKESKISNHYLAKASAVFLFLIRLAQPAG